MLAKPAHQSKTLRFNRIATYVAAAAAFVPTVVSFLIEVLGDPQIAAAVAHIVPAQYRTILFLVVAYLARRNTALRYQTSTPIQGSEGAVELETTMKELGTPATQAKE